MEPRISMITLGVSDLERSVRFYRDVLKLPQIEAPPEVAFFDMGKAWLSLYPRVDLAADATVSAEGSGFPGFTLAHNLASREAVDALFAELAASEVRIVKPAKQADWGGYSGYFADPDGFLWELAWNPHFPHV